jgi:DNA mismatch endonuclease (patch repair protein)
MQTRVKTPKSRSIAVRNVMRANKGVDTGPEIRLRSLVHKAGLRYAIDVRPELDLNRRADLVFRSAKVAVFVNGCFWHGCPKHYSPPKSNKRYWSEKVRRNRERDVETRSLLRRRGWRVLVFWEHQSAQSCSEKVVSVVSERRKRASRQ